MEILRGISPSNFNYEKHHGGMNKAHENVLLVTRFDVLMI